MGAPFRGRSARDDTPAMGSDSFAVAPRHCGALNHPPIVSPEADQYGLVSPCAPPVGYVPPQRHGANQDLRGSQQIV